MPAYGMRAPYVEMPGRLTVAENLEVYARLFGLRRPKNRIAKLSRDLDLESFLHLSLIHI